jgi:hypothetical protein
MSRATLENEAFDALEDALAAGFGCSGDNFYVHIEDIMPLMEAARAVLMIHRGVKPLMPQRKPA